MDYCNGTSTFILKSLRSEFLIVERRPQFFYNRKLTLMKKFFSIAIFSNNAFEIVQRSAKARKIFADGRILDLGLKKNFSHTGI